MASSTRPAAPDMMLIQKTSEFSENDTALAYIWLKQISLDSITTCALKKTLGKLWTNEVADFSIILMINCFKNA